MKCWRSALNAQGLRLIMVVVQLGAVKIYVATVEAVKENEREEETQFTTKIDGFLSFIPHWMLIYFWAGFWKISPCVWPNWGLRCCVFLTLRITLLQRNCDEAVAHALIGVWCFVCITYVWRFNAVSTCDHHGLKGICPGAFPGIKSACHDLFHGSGRNKSMAPYKRRAAPNEFWKEPFLGLLNI